MTFTSKTARFTFETYAGAVEGLLVTLEDARETSFRYRITGVTPTQIIRSGLLLEGEIDAISEKLSLISGATRRDF